MHRLLFLLDFSAILFAISAVLGMLTGYDRSLGFGLLVAVLGSAILYLIIAHIKLSWLIAQGISIILLSATACFALIFILQFAYQNYTDTPSFILRLGGFTTLLPNLNISLPHPNAAATLIIGILPFGFLLALSRRSTIYRVFGLICSLVMLYALVLTFSRGAFIGLAAAILIAFMLRSRRFALFIGLGILAVVVAFVVLYNLQNINVVNGAFSWASSRLELYQNSLYVASDYLFTGIGLGNTFAMVYSRYGLLIQVPFLTYVHNLPLAVWMGQGLLGLIAFGGLVVSFYMFAIHVVHTTRPQAIFYGAWIGVTATLIHGFFDARQYVEGAWLMPTLFLLIGLTVTTGRMAISEIAVREFPTAPSRNRLPALSVAAIAIVLIGAGFIFNRQLAAAWNTNLGALEETEAELSPALSHEQRLSHFETARNYYRSALALNANWPNANRRLGNLNVNLEDFDESVALLEKAYAREPLNPATIKGLGLAYTWVGRIDDAVQMFNLLPDPLGTAQELDVWGYYRGEQGNALLSAYAYETALVMRGDEVNVLMWRLLGEAYLRAGRPDDARRWYKRVLEVEPDNAEALQALAEIGAMG